MDIIQVYTPTSAHNEQESDLFYDALQLHIQKVPRKENMIVVDDLNANLRADRGVWAPTLDMYTELQCVTPTSNTNNVVGNMETPIWS